MDELDKTMPPLAGVLHLAGALDDGLLENLTIERFYKVFQGKAIGAWNLHQATEGIDLDYFVMFSGGVALLGNAGQSSYTAANAFLDGLATWRKSRGLPSLSVNWGAWSGGGMAVRTKGETGRDALTAQGYGKIDLMDGLEALEKLVFAPLSRIAVLPINWSRLGESMGGRLPALISRLTRPKADVVSPTVGVPKTESFLLNWSSAAADKRRSLLADHLASTASRVMGLGAGRKIRPSQPLQELGLDSLMAVELRNALARSLETKLPATLLFDYPSIEALVDFVGAKLLLSTRSGMGEVESAIQKTKKWKVEADVADLSDAEAEALLKAELDDLERNK
jgi:acyl carrier protein